ncbi:hypothetical protein GCM10027176_29760 [Actinoallomurus bryophytorum]|uniref:Uncharacterized protein n=1 Tax=Actinoallomurus bryophytorum TaxID=1490222 RepID=A0A543CGE1_9ACTN|nr:hypothetical protein [Actinoallomurus bryophytorum]TQL96163.1 hypothetical protein FB559_1685 [Actinoallomurus bryophytorum]
MGGKTGFSFTTSSFGWTEEDVGVQTCSEPDCDPEQVHPTDVYCDTHDRFLPIVSDWSNSARVTTMIACTGILLAALALTAEFDSWVPAFFVLGLSGLGVLAFPLRNFPMTVRGGVALWIFAALAALTCHVGSPHTDAEVVAGLLVAVGCMLAAHAAYFSASSVLVDPSLDPQKWEGRSRRAIALISAIFAFSGTGGLAYLAFLVTPMIADSVVGGAVLYISAGALILGLLFAILAGTVNGPWGMSIEVRNFEDWDGFARVHWRPETKPINRTSVIGIAKIYAITERAITRIGNTFNRVAYAVAEKAVNTFFAIVRFLVNFAIYMANFAVTLVVLTFRAMVAAAVGIFGIAARSVGAALWSIVSALVVLGIPVVAIGLAAGLVPTLAEEERGYLVDGSLGSLTGFIAVSFLGVVSLTFTWIMLANQRLRVSLESAKDTATNTGIYGVILLSVGGWIVGLPGTLGYGRIHVGWVTLVSTGFLVAALIWFHLQRRGEPKPTSGGSEPGSRPSLP